MHRTVNHHIERELFGECCMNTKRSFVFKHDVENSRGIINGPGQSARKGKYRSVGGRIAITPGFILCAPYSFACHHVWVGASKSGILDRLVHVEHNFISRRNLHYFVVVSNHVLVLMALTAWHFIYISRFKP